MGRDLGVVSKMNQSLAANQHPPHMMLVTRFSSGIHLQVIINLRCSLKQAKVWFFIGQPTLINHISKIILR